MKKHLRTLLCVLLCAAIVLPAVTLRQDAMAAVEEEHDHSDHEAVSEPSAQESGGIKSGTIEQIEAMECTAESASENGGKHKLGSTSSIYPSPDGKTYVRGLMNLRVYEASCTRGSGMAMDRVCKYCHKWFTIIQDGDEPASGHTYSEPAKVETSSCDGLTYTMKTCSVCGFVKVSVEDGEIDPEEHKEVVTTTTTPGNHTVDVVAITKCDECGVVLECETLGPAGHPGLFRTTKNPGCFTDGEEVFYCFNCDYTLERALKQYGDHFKATRIIEPATCEKSGLKETYCSSCGEKLSGPDVIPQLEHDWVKVSPSVCEQKPYYQCKHCGLTKDGDDGPIEHQWGERQTKAPTCTEDGYSYKRCEKCGVEQTIEGTTVAATGEHKFTVKANVVNPTCGTPGSYQDKCITCGQLGEVHETDPTGNHTPVADDGNCETPVLCSVCSLVVTEAKTHSYTYKRVPALQHQATYYHTKKCSNSGCKISETEVCSGEDDGNCGTEIKCTFCGGTVKGSLPHFKSGVFIEYPGAEDEYHVELCRNEGCNQYYGERAPHTYENGTCTVCGHVDGREHIPDGVWKSDGSFHWQNCALCGGKMLVSSHDKTSASAYDGDCSKGASCTVCGYLVKAPAEGHSFTGDWEITDEYHYRVCTNPGCTVTETVTHTPYDDGDCTTANTCTECGYEVVKAGAGHSWVVAGSGHTATHHKLVCTNPGCEETSSAEHKAGITATCRDKAECADCHTEFGETDPNNHVGGTQIKNAKPATSEEEGYTGDTYCLGCGVLIEKGETIEKLPERHVHEYTQQQSNAAGHWMTCSCGQVDEHSRAVHTFDSWSSDGASTHSHMCSVCGYSESERHEHGEDPHDCTADITCVDCGAVVAPAAAEEHSFNGRAVGTAEGHVIGCTNPNCEQTTPVIPHVGGSSSCESGAHCDICGYEYLVKDPTVHTGEPVVKNAKPATAEEDGYTGDIYCGGCGELIEKGSVIPQLEMPAGELVDEENDVTAKFPDEDADFYTNIELIVEKLSKGDTDYTPVENTVGAKFSTYIPFDISLLDTVTGDEVQPNGKLTISVPVPEGWSATKTAVYHVSGDEMEKVDVTASDDGAYVSFTVDHFSVYVLVNAESEINTPADPGDTPADPGDTPADPDDTPTDPGDTPADPGDTPADPGDTPADPGDTPNDPGDTPADPGDTPADPGDTPADPGDTPTDPGDADPSVPVTGDGTHMGLMLIVLVLSAAGLVVTAMELKKYRKN